MTNWSDFLSCLIRSISLSAAFVLFVAAQAVAQNIYERNSRTSEPVESIMYSLSADSALEAKGYPDPTSVLYKSMIIPGWGQVVNDQVWKVPIIYGLLAGLTGYSIFLTKRYHDYRAAFYNANDELPNDERFGSTPDFLVGVTNLNSLRSNRNNFRNRRDFIYVTIGLAYGLNIIDAYIFAHLRSFDVSEDLSMRTGIKPGVLAYSTPGVTFSVELFNKHK